MEIGGSHYVLAVPDLERARDWYERVLGCETEVVDAGNWLFFHRDGVTFMCGRCPDAIPVADLGDHQYFAYLVGRALVGFEPGAVLATTRVLASGVARAAGLR